MAKGNKVSGSTTKALKSLGGGYGYGLPARDTFPVLDADNALADEGEVRVQIATTRQNGGFYCSGPRFVPDCGRR